MLREAGVADLFDVFLRNDPPGAAGTRIEGQKVEVQTPSLIVSAWPNLPCWISARALQGRISHFETVGKHLLGIEGEPRFV